MERVLKMPHGPRKGPRLDPWLASSLLLCAVPASANPGVSGAPNMLVLLAATCLTLLLIRWSGAGRIMEAAGIRRWGVATRIVVMILMFFAGVIGFWFILMFGLAGFAIQAGVRMLRWGRAAADPKPENPAYLSEARPRRLVAAGCASIAAAVVAVGLCGYFAYDLDMKRFFRMDSRGRTRNEIYHVRDMLERFRGKTGRYPENLDAPNSLGFPGGLPAARLYGFHADSGRARYGKQVTDEGGWLYDNIAGDADFGAIWVNCTHTDLRGSIWSSY